MIFLSSTLRLFSFYFSQLSLLAQLPSELIIPEDLERKMNTEKSFQIRVESKKVNQYNQGLDQLTRELARNMTRRVFDFHTLMVLFFAIRVVAIGVAMLQPKYVGITIVVSAMQFLIMPFSFFVAVTQFVALFPPMFVGHLICFWPLKLLVNQLPEIFHLEFTFEAWHVWTFFIVDQLICLYILFDIPGRGKAVSFSTNRVLASVFYSFLNAKSFYLVLLPHIIGLKIDVTVWLIDALFGVTQRINELVSLSSFHWAVLFYHQHRMGHIPFVYDHAHKFHHYLHDSTSFDAHIYGSGAPEEYFILVMELVLGCFFRWTPVSLTYHVLNLSFANKIGHSRSVLEKGGKNAHVDHHTYHRKNFGIYGMALDMCFETCVYNDRYAWNDYDIIKSVKSDEIVFDFIPTVIEPVGGSNSN